MRAIHLDFQFSDYITMISLQFFKNSFKKNCFFRIFANWWSSRIPSVLSYAAAYL